MKLVAVLSSLILLRNGLCAIIPQRVPRRFSQRGFLDDILPDAITDPINALIGNSGDSSSGSSAAAAAPPGNYAPMTAACPAQAPEIRSAAAGLSPAETAFLNSRRTNSIPAMQDFITRAAIPGFDAAKFFSDHKADPAKVPNLGIAVSGGGYRATLNGAGAIRAFDSREAQKGPVSGVLQAANYLSGLSGGSWLVGSIFMNNFAKISDLQASPPGTVWDFSRSILVGPKTGKPDILSIPEYWDTVVSQVKSKDDAKFETTITDFWGRTLSFQLINATDGGPGVTWSSVTGQKDFSSGQTPLPILVTDARPPGDNGEAQIIPETTSVFEISPFEFGSWDSSLSGFVDTKFAGSAFDGGKIPNGQCTTGFDSGSFVMGTSSSLFNSFLLQANTTDVVPGVVKDLLTPLLELASKKGVDVASWKPSPFKGFQPPPVPAAASADALANPPAPFANQDELDMVDGAEDLENIPMQPLLQPARALDVVIAVDGSGDTLGPNSAADWPNGTSLIATAQRAKANPGAGIVVPDIPDANTFVNLGLNAKPVFFGCDNAQPQGTAPPASAVSGGTSGSVAARQAPQANNGPLIVYLPNTPYTALSNTSTFQLEYATTQRDDIVANAQLVASHGADPQWPQCLACAMLTRSLDKTGTPVPPACANCFQKYCYNGTVDDKPAVYQPTLLGAQAFAAGA